MTIEKPAPTDADGLRFILMCENSYKPTEMIALHHAVAKIWPEAFVLAKPIPRDAFEALWRGNGCIHAQPSPPIVERLRRLLDEIAAEIPAPSPAKSPAKRRSRWVKAL